MLRIENNNREVLDFINAKLIKDNSKLFKKLPKNEQSESKEKIVNGMTLGTDNNKKVLIASAIPSGGLFAVGIVQALLGLVACLPTIEQPQGEEAIAFFEKARNYGESKLYAGVHSMGTGIALLALPVGISVISLSTKIYQNLIRKRKQTINNNNIIIDLIDDLIEPSVENDKTIEFASRFIKKVDLSENKPKMNLEIIKYLAYYRSMLILQEQGDADSKDVENAYEILMGFLKSTLESQEVSDNYKHNRYLNIIISEYEDNKNELVTEEGKTR